MTSKMASTTSDNNLNKRNEVPQAEESYLNVSLESDHLDPDQKAAHEADTLPMDGHQAPQTKQPSLWSAITERFLTHISPIMTKENELPPNPNLLDRLKYSFSCPPHGKVSKMITYTILLLSLWGSCISMFGDIATPPHGTIFWLIILVTVAMLFGWIFSLAQLPPLLGMLLTGIVIKNIPGVMFDDWWNHYSSTLRSIALVVILMRAGLGLDPGALKRLSGMVIRLAFIPCVTETLIVGISSRLLFKYALGYEFPWLWGFLLGFVLAAVSPAVVVPSLLELQDKGYGVDKGIPTLVIAAASVDDVLAISGFSILLGLAFQGGVVSENIQNDLLESNPTIKAMTANINTSVSDIVLHNPCNESRDCDENVAIEVFEGIGKAIKEALAGIFGGIFWGLICIMVPNRNSKNVVYLRTAILLFGGFLALFGSEHESIDLKGSGALAVLVMAFVAGVGWRNCSQWEQDNDVTKILANAWMIFQPILFVLIGTEIQVNG